MEVKDFKILITSSSFLGSEGKHTKLLHNNFHKLTFKEGPLNEEDLLEVFDEAFDGIICGDDQFSSKVLEKAKGGGLKVLSKYGTGLDKINLNYCRENNIIVKNCVGVNKTTVAEHVFALLLSTYKNIIDSINDSRKGIWKRRIGRDLSDKTIGIIGAGNIGKEVFQRSLAFNMNPIYFDSFLSEIKVGDKQYSSEKKLEDLLKKSDIISLHLPLLSDTQNLIGTHNSEFLKPGVTIVNTSRGGIVNEEFLLNALDDGTVANYLTDVLANEPEINPEFLKRNNFIITQHLGSRTIENIEKQGLCAVKNLIDNLIP